MKCVGADHEVATDGRAPTPALAAPLERAPTNLKPNPNPNPNLDPNPNPNPNSNPNPNPNPIDGDVYYMLDDFNHHHHHAVLAGSCGRISSTHRVAVTATDTWQHIWARGSPEPSPSP